MYPCEKLCETIEKTKMYTICANKNHSFLPVNNMFHYEIDKINQKAKEMELQSNQTHYSDFAFPGSYWLHSYNLSYDGSYGVDISNGFVMVTEEFNALVRPQILDQTLGAEMPNRLNQIKSDKNWPFKHILEGCPLKALAFYAFDSKTLIEQEEFYKR